MALRTARAHHYVKHLRKRGTTAEFELVTGPWTGAVANRRDALFWTVWVFALHKRGLLVFRCRVQEQKLGGLPGSLSGGVVIVPCCYGGGWGDEGESVGQSVSQQQQLSGFYLTCAAAHITREKHCSALLVFLLVFFLLTESFISERLPWLFPRLLSTRTQRRARFCLSTTFTFATEAWRESPKTTETTLCLYILRGPSGWIGKSTAAVLEARSLYFTHVIF